jgi:predicted protein tyrosine phosphatase
MIVVCSLARLAETVKQHGARHVVTLLKDGDKVFCPEGVGAEDHLWLSMDDIANEIDGMVPPGEAHVAKLIEFLKRWDRKNPLVMHCFAGISRSSAAAFIAACVAEPNKDEAELARRIRAASPTASPNPRLVALADKQLGRQGRMVKAIAEIGPGHMAYEAEPFVLMLD